MPYQYDVFISYSSADRPWALKLTKDLRSNDIRVFLDQDRLDIGKDWAPQLAGAVQSSQHLVALWSDNSDKSGWVRREVSYFEALNDPSIAKHGDNESRWYSFLMLEGDSVAYAGVQGINSLKEAEAYDKDSPQKGADMVNASLWQKVVDRLAEAIQKNDKSTPIPLAVLAMTQDDLNTLDPNKKPLWGPDLNSLLKTIGIGDRDALAKANSYGPERTDWHPFGHPLNVRQILDNLLNEINKEGADRAVASQLKEPEFQFRWDLIDPKFWSDDTASVTAEQNKLLSRSSTIVIDPLSLYDDSVYDALVTLSDCFNCDSCNIMVLTPCSLPQSFLALGALVERRGRPFFNPYWNPPVPNLARYARLGVNLSHERELRRVLRKGLSYFIGQTNPRADASWLNQGPS